jgi:hypothetical protein
MLLFWAVGGTYCLHLVKLQVYSFTVDTLLSGGAEEPGYGLSKFSVWFKRKLKINLEKVL